MVIIWLCGYKFRKESPMCISEDMYWWGLSFNQHFDSKLHTCMSQTQCRHTCSFSLLPHCFWCCYRYEYDDHYFLTDPREFIYEFFPLQQEWQLLKNPITLQDFEELPFVRSLFFRYGLYFPDSNTKAVMYTDSTGEYCIVCEQCHSRNYCGTLFCDVV